MTADRQSEPDRMWQGLLAAADPVDLAAGYLPTPASAWLARPVPPRAVRPSRRPLPGPAAASTTASRAFSCWSAP